MIQDFVEKVLKRLPHFDEKNAVELKIKVGSWSCCMTRDDNGKWIRNEAIMHFISDSGWKNIRIPRYLS